MNEEINYYSDYIEDASEFISFDAYMQRRGSYFCEWCKRIISAINIKEASETNCAFVFVHDDEQHPCDAIFSCATEINLIAVPEESKNE